MPEESRSATTSWITEHLASGESRKSSFLRFIGADLPSDAISKPGP
jgi:hypothetical protein